ncbi:hypothetical protein B1B_18839 [mine drainage metagenome]|uniref:Uncharacterized protein n=1 Tax=mine drainage metagenome TaxID=410659 RepID=T0YAQ2_9ZZZZ
MGDLLRKLEYIEPPDVTCVLNYRLNFDGERSCGSVVVYSGTMKDGGENFEIYMELLECGLSEEDAVKKFDRVISDVREGRIDVVL